MQHRSRVRPTSAVFLSDGGTERHHLHHDKCHHGRFFDYGELHLPLLAMITERPRHGYQLINAIEERMEGCHTPSLG